MTMNVSIHAATLTPAFDYKVDFTLEAGIAYWMKAANGKGKSSLLEEIKVQLKDFAPGPKLSFLDQAPLMPFGDMSVESVFRVFYEVAHKDLVVQDWRELSLSQAVQFDQHAKAMVKNLSGGENQWLKILLMSSLKADFYIWDEPQLNLDLTKWNLLLDFAQDLLDQKKYLLLTHHGTSGLSLRPLGSFELKRDQQKIWIEEG